MSQASGQSTLDTSQSKRVFWFSGIQLSNGITPSQQMVSSCSGALLTSVLVTPLDVVKIRLQAQHKPVDFTKGHRFLYRNGLMDHLFICPNGNCNKKHLWYRKPGHFKGTIDAFINIARYEGLMSLWSGLPPTLVMAVPATVIYFTSYEQIKAFLFSVPTGVNNWWVPLTAGAIARVWAVSVISPLELVRTKVQSEQLSYSQIGHAIRVSIKQDGIMSLWRGWGPTILRDVPFSAMYWFGYENMKSQILRKTGSSQLTFTQSFSSGALSGTLAAVVTLPFDVVKTHRQIELGLASKGMTQALSTWVLIANLYKHRGLRALYAGLVPRVVKIAPACAIMISTYEYCKLFFKTMNETNRQIALQPSSNPVKVAS